MTIYSKLALLVPLILPLKPFAKDDFHVRISDLLQASFARIAAYTVVHCVCVSFLMSWGRGDGLRGPKSLNSFHDLPDFLEGLCLR
jgi:hypothetical protein